MRNIALAAVLLTAASLYFLLPRLVPLAMRPTALLLIVLAAASSAVLLIPRLVPPSTPPTVVIHSEGPTVEKLERLSQLVTTRIQIADILVAEGNGCRGSWLIKDDALLSVNLGQASITDKHDDTKQATIILPEPQVLQPRVDHSRTRTVGGGPPGVAAVERRSRQPARCRDGRSPEARLAHGVVRRESQPGKTGRGDSAQRAVFGGWLERGGDVGHAVERRAEGRGSPVTNSPANTRCPAMAAAKPRSRPDYFS